MTTPLTTPGNILIIDDTPANLDVLARFLTDHGHKVRPAISGEIGLKAAAKAPPDLILLDIQMPGMNGFEVCQHLKSDLATADIPVIFISALDATDDKVRAFNVGGVDYITKPFQVMEVLARVESQLRIQWQRRRIEGLVAFKDEVIGIVSHDLRNPLGVMMGYAEMIEQDVTAGEPISPEVVSLMRRAGSTMLSLIQDLLDNARFEQRIPLRFERVHLQALIGEQMGGYRMITRGTGITLRTVFAPEPIVLTLDPRRFVQVVGNLVTNAIKYSPRETTITLHIGRDGEHAFIAVEDQGYGIPAGDLPHVFEKFFRVNTAQHMRAEGTGLGLPIARMIVEQHGGTLTAASTEGVGSVFTITLPLDGADGG